MMLFYILVYAVIFTFTNSIKFNSIFILLILVSYFIIFYSVKRHIYIYLYVSVYVLKHALVLSKATKNKMHLD